MDKKRCQEPFLGAGERGESPAGRNWLADWPAATLIALVRLYQLTLSPFLGRQCRFEPTCSHYFIGSVRKHGAWRGAWRGVLRICRCHPLQPGGWDPP